MASKFEPGDYYIESGYSLPNFYCVVDIAVKTIADTAHINLIIEK